MDSKICTPWIIKKVLKILTKKNAECKICNSNRSLKRYYENKD